MKELCKRLRADCAALWQACRPHGSGWPYLLVVSLIAISTVFLRMLFLSYPMRYDEAYTVTAFANRPWLNLLSDYSLPNNHIFHSILVKLAMQMFGSDPWVVRLPAFIHGILCIPAVYLLARQLYGRSAAILSAGLVAALPMMTTAATNARGYSQYMFYSLILFNLGIILLKQANLAGWGMFILTAAVGCYTVPFMLFPFGAACLWMAVSAVGGEARQAYGSIRRFIKYLAAALILTALITILLYSPVFFIGTGWQSLTGNPFVTPQSWTEFWPMFGDQLRNVWRTWNEDIPLLVQILLTGSVIISLVFHHKVSHILIPIQCITITWNLGMSLALRRSLDRVWLYLLPLWLIWASGGLTAVLRSVRIPKKIMQVGLVALILLITVFLPFQRAHHYFPGWQADPGKVETAAEFISRNLQPGDAVAVVFPYDAPYWYYLTRSGVPDESIHHINRETHPRVFVVVNQHEVSGPAEVLQAQGLSPEEYQVESAQLIYSINDQDIYLCLHG